MLRTYRRRAGNAGVQMFAMTIEMRLNDNGGQAVISSGLFMWFKRGPSS